MFGSLQFRSLIGNICVCSSFLSLLSSIRMLIISSFLSFSPFWSVDLSEIFLSKIITSSLTGLKNKSLSLTGLKGTFFTRNHCPSVKKFSLPFLRDFPEKHAFQSLFIVGIPGHMVMIFVMVASMELLA